MLLKIGVAMMALALAFAAVVAFAAFLNEPMQLATAVKSAAKPAVEPLTRSDPGVDPWVERNIPAPRPEPQPETQAEPVAETVSVPQPGSDLEPKSEVRAKPGPRPEVKPKLESQPEALLNQESLPKDQARAKPEPRVEFLPRSEPEVEPQQGTLPVSDDNWPAPTDEELQAVNGTRRYGLPPGAIMGLTIRAIGLYGVPVINSDNQWAFDTGVVHEPETSLPWSDTPQRNVYLAAHRLGYRGTWTRLVFYNLDRLGEGDRIVIKDRDGREYEYRVSESFVVDPTDTWVMGRIEGRDMLTLQTCTPIPSFDKRLIVRAERI